MPISLHVWLSCSKKWHLSIQSNLKCWKNEGKPSETKGNLSTLKKEVFPQYEFKNIKTLQITLHFVQITVRFVLKIQIKKSVYFECIFSTKRTVIWISGCAENTLKIHWKFNGFQNQKNRKKCTQKICWRMGKTALKQSQTKSEIWAPKKKSQSQNDSE